MNVEFGKQNILSSRFGCWIGFTPNKFTQPPVVICQLVRSSPNVWNDRPLNIYPDNITTSGFQFNVRGDYKPGDQCHWISIGN